MSSVHLEPQDLPDAAPHNHGMTRAAWVTNILLTVGAILIALGIAFGAHAFTWTGIAVAVGGLVAGAILRALGHGQSLG